jgi:hypothetical protein
MKLEYFADAFDGAGVLLLYESSAAEVGRLRVALRTLSDVGSSISLHELEFIEPVNGCEVIARSDSVGGGLRSAPDQPAFRWVLSPKEWEHVTDLLEPFCMATAEDVAGRFQYLHEHSGPEVIYSTVRGW